MTHLFTALLFWPAPLRRFDNTNLPAAYSVVGPILRPSSKFVLLLSILVFRLLCIAPLHAEPPTLSADAFEELRVPASALTSELLQGRVPVPLTEYQRIKQGALATRDAPPAIRLVAAEYAATYDNHRFTEGRLNWTIRNLHGSAVSWKVHSLGLALRDLRWSDQPALWGMSAARRFEVVVDRTQGGLSGTWELDGEVIVRHDEFLFRIPQATVSTFKLRVPVGYSVTIPGITVPQPTAAESGWNLWTIYLGSQTESRISIHPPAPPGSPSSLVQVRSQTMYGVRQEGLRFDSRLNLEVSQNPIREVALSIDEELEAYSITYGEVALPWKSESLEGKQRLTVTLPDALLGAGRVLRLRGVAPIKTDAVWKLPQLAVEGSALDEGQAVVQIAPPLQLQQLQTEGYLQSSIENMTTRDDLLNFKQFRQDGALRVTLGKPRSRLLARVLSDLQTKTSDWTCLTQLQLTATEGAAFELKCRIPANWDVTDVRDINSPKLEWSIITETSGERVLLLRLLEALSADKPRTIEIDAHRSSGPADQTFSIPAFEPLGTDRLEMLVAINSAPDVKPVLEAGSSYESCQEPDLDSEWTSSKFWQTRFADRNPKPLLLRLNSAASEGQFTLQSLQTPVEVVAEMKLQFTPEKITKTVVLHVTPQRGRTERVLVYQSEPGPQLSWILAGTPGRSVEARKLPTIRHAAWDLPTTGELWELRLPQPQSTPFTLEGVRTRGLPPTGRLGLVFVPQAQTFRGQVSVDAPAELGLELTAQKTESDGVTENVPGPLKRSWSFHQPGAALRFQTRVAAAQAPSPVIRRVALEARWTLEPEGFDYYIARLELGSGFRNSEFRIGLPASAEVIEVQIDRQPIQFESPAEGSPLVLSNILDEQVVAVAYRSPSRMAHGPVARRVLLPRVSVPVLRFDLELMTPSGFRLGGDPVGMVLKSESGSISTLQRLFGPLGRPNSDAWFNPLLWSRWKDLLSPAEPPSESIEVNSVHHNRLELIHAGWQIFRGSAALLPEHVDVWLWSSRQAQGAAWLAFWGSLLLGAMLRLARLPNRGVLGSLALVAEILLAFTLPSVPAQIVGAALAGTLLATLWPRSLIARKPPVSPMVTSIPQESTQSYRALPKQPSSPQMTLTVLIAFSISCLCFCGALAAQPMLHLVKGQPAYSSRVLIPTSTESKSSAETSWVYVPERLLKDWSSVNAGPSGVPGWLIQSGEYTLVRDPSGQAAMTARFDVLVLATTDEVELGFPLAGINFGGSAACQVNGQALPILSRGDGKTLFIRLPGAEPEVKPPAPAMPETTGSSEATGPTATNPGDRAAEVWPIPVRRLKVEFQGYPVLRSVAGGTWMELTLPALNSARVTIRNEQTDGPWALQINGMRRDVLLNQPLSMELGPVSQLRVETSPASNLEVIAPKIEARLATLAEVQPALTRMSYQAKYTITAGRVSNVVWQLPPRLVVRQVVGPEVFDWRVEALKDGSSRLQIDLRTPVAEGFFVRVDATLPNDGSAMQAVLPAVQLLASNDTPFRPLISLVGVRTLSEFQVEAPGDLAEQFAVATVDDFLREWSEVELKPTLVFSLLDSSPLKVGLKLLSPQRVVRMTAIGVLGSRQLQWNLNATIEVQNAAAFSHQLEIDPRLLITNVSIQEDAANRLLRWTRSGNMLHVFLRDKTTGTQNLSLQGSMPTQIPQEELTLPTVKFHDATVADAKLQLYQEPDLEVEIASATQWERLEMPSEVRVGPARSQLIVGRFKWPGDASPFIVRVAHNEPVLNYSAVTAVQPRDGRWKQTTSLLFQVEHGHGSQFAIRVPPELPRVLVEAGDVRLLLEKETDGSQRIALIPQTPVRGRFVVQISGEVNMPTTGQATIPEILGLNATKKDHYIVLPEEAHLSVDSRNSGLIVTPLPTELSTLLPADLQVATGRGYRGAGANWTVSIPRPAEESPRAGVLWTETQIWCGPTKNMAGRTTTVVGPQELENLEFSIPAEISLQGVLLDGEFVPHTGRQDQSLKIPLTFPQSGHIVTLYWTQETASFEGWMNRSEFSWPRVVGQSVSEQYVTLTPPTGFRARTNVGQSVERVAVQLGELTVLLQLMKQRAADGPAPQDVLWTFLQHRAAGLIRRLQGESRLQTRNSEFKERFSRLQAQFAPWAPLTAVEMSDLEDFHAEGDVLKPFASLEGNLAGPHSLLVQFEAGPPQSQFSVSMFHESLRNWGLGLLLGFGVFALVWPLLRWHFPEWLARHPAIAWTLLGLTWWVCLQPSILGLAFLSIAATIALRNMPWPRLLQEPQA